MLVTTVEALTQPLPLLFKRNRKENLDDMNTLFQGALFETPDGAVAISKDLVVDDP